MSDIVKRLRAAAFNDAADEIERLTHALAISGEEGDAHIKEIKRLRTILQATLDAITRAQCQPTPELTTAYENARHALEGK